MSGTPEPRRRRLRLVFALLIAAPAGMSLAETEGGRGIPEDVRVESIGGGVDILRFERTFESERAADDVRIRNPWGDVRVRRAPGNSVELSVVIQRLAAGAPLPDIDASRKRGRFEVRIDYPGSPTRHSAGGTRPGRVDLVVLAPATASVDVETDDGEIRVSHTARPVRARAVSGRIVASGSSTFDIETGSGHILVRQVGGIPGPSRIRAESGSVSVLVSPTGNQRLRVRAGSGIYAGPGWGDEPALGLTDGATRFERRWGTGRHRFDIESRDADVQLLPFLSLDGEAPDDPPEGRR